MEESPLNEGNAVLRPLLMDGGRNVNDGQLMVVLGSYWFVIGLITMAVLNDNGG